MERKRGKLSTADEDFIKYGLKNGFDAQGIADELNRTVKTIEKYISDNNLTYKGMSEQKYDDTVLRGKLEEAPYWTEIQQQFTEQELEYFAITWINMMKQFSRDNVLYSEELQVKQWITLEIMGNRVMRDRKSTQNSMDRLERLLEQEYNVDEDLRDAETISQLETEVSMLRSSMSAHTNEHAKILEKIEKIQRDLRANRSDRIKQIDDSKTSWQGLLAALENEDIRTTIGEDIEISRMAKDAAKERLSEWHQYEDGLVDQPLLTTETMKESEE